MHDLTDLVHDAWALTHDQWSAIGTWVGALSTAFTLAFAVYQWWRKWTSDQASKVYAWESRTKGVSASIIELGNGSKLPVYDVFVYQSIVAPYRHDPLWKRWVAKRLSSWLIVEIVLAARRVADAEEGGKQLGRTRVKVSSVFTYPARIQVLPPGKYTTEGFSERIAQQLDASAAELFSVELVFRDTRGKLWTRRSSGKLARNYISPHWFKGSRAAAAETSGSVFVPIVPHSKS